MNAELKKQLVKNQAELDQARAEADALFRQDIVRMLRLLVQLSESDDPDEIRSLPDEDLNVVAVLAMMSMNELLQQAGTEMVEKLESDHGT